MTTAPDFTLTRPTDEPELAQELDTLLDRLQSLISTPPPLRRGGYEWTLRGIEARHALEAILVLVNAAPR